jgi:hypothetical protein
LKFVLYEYTFLLQLLLYRIQKYCFASFVPWGRRVFPCCKL